MADNNAPDTSLSLTAEAEAAALIEKLRKEYPDFQTLTLKDKAGNVAGSCHLKQPGRNVVARAMSLLAQNKLLEAGEFILEECFIGDRDNPVLTDERTKMAASMQCIQLVELLDGELKKN